MSISTELAKDSKIITVESIENQPDEEKTNIFGVFRTQFNRVLALSCLLLISSSFSHGFDNQGFATIQAMNPFVEQFGEYQASSKSHAIPAYFLSYLNSFQYIGFAVGLAIGSYISSRFGRKWCIRSMSAYAIVTAIIAVTSKRKEQILSARVLNYVFIGMEMAVIPVFQAEITPAKARGFMVGAFQFSLSIGGLVVHIITNATANRQDSSSWRIPVGLFFIFPIIVGILINFVPESPRWLLSQSREEEALKSLRLFRQGKFSDAQILEEFSGIQVSLKELDTTQGTYADLFRGNNLKRTLIVVGVNVFQQVTGQAFASQYGTIYIKSLGTVNPFQMSIVNSVVGIVAVALSLLLNDKLGRKTFMYIGLWVQAGALLAMGGLGTHITPTVPQKNGIVAMMTMFMFGFSFGYAPLAYVISSEIPSLRLKDKTYRIGYLCNILFAFLVAFTLPYLLNKPYANLQSKVGFIYGAFSVLGLIFTYFFVPECGGKSLEEIDYCFYKQLPLRKFKKFDPQESGDFAAFKEEFRVRASDEKTLSA